MPVVVDGVMYLTAPDGVYALVPETGELLWKYDATPMALRGLAYWPGAGGLHSRVFAGNGPFLLALDVTTGKPAPGFGNEGRVDLKQGVLGDLKDGRYTLQSPPAVFGDVVITGCSNGEGSPTRRRVWRHSRLGCEDAASCCGPFTRCRGRAKPGAETWPADAWKNRSGTNVWGFFTVDVKRGIVYAPLGSPTSDFYGADRVGDNLYGNSLVALDARTGEKKWHRQLVHHDLWDYDLAAPPALFDIHRGGRVIPAVAQITKMGLLFVFDRVTGEPVYGMEERPVPQSTVPGEVTAKTQPFPVKPPPLGKNTFRMEEMYDRSPEHARFCKELFETNQMKIGAPYTPLPLEGNALFFPSTLGGGNWGGVSVDPALRPAVRERDARRRSGATWRSGAPSTCGRRHMGPYARFWNRETRIPCQNPPFGEMIAVDLASGDIAWRSPLGRIEALEAIGVRDTGTLNLGGSIATAGGVVFIGATNDARFRAFDSKIGQGALGSEAGGERAHQPDYVHGARRAAIRGADGGRGRRVSGWRREQYAGGVCAAGCSPQAVAGIGVEGGGGGRRGQARRAEGRRVRAGGAAGGRSEGVGGEDLRDGLSFGRGGDEPADEGGGMECDGADHGGARRAGVGRGGEGDRGVSGEDTGAVSLSSPARAAEVNSIYAQDRSLVLIGPGSFSLLRVWRPAILTDVDHDSEVGSSP